MAGAIIRIHLGASVNLPKFRQLGCACPAFLFSLFRETDFVAAAKAGVLDNVVEVGVVMAMVPGSGLCLDYVYYIRIMPYIFCSLIIVDTFFLKSNACCG